MIAEPFVTGEFGIEFCKDARDVELQHGGVGAGEALDVNGRGEDGEVTGLERAEVVALDLGDLGHLMNIKLLLFAGELELLGDGGHAA